MLKNKLSTKSVHNLADNILRNKLFTSSDIGQAVSVKIYLKARKI